MIKKDGLFCSLTITDGPTYQGVWPKAECPSCAAKDATLKHKVARLEKVVEGKALTNVCPFCYQDDFDRVGLKHHLLVGDCDDFNEVAALAEKEGG